MASFATLGDIKAEFAASRSKATGSWTIQGNTFRIADQLSSHAPASKTDEIGFDPGPIGAAAGRFTTGGGGDSFNAWRDVRDHNHGKLTDALSNARLSQDIQEGYWDWSSEPTPHDLTSSGRALDIWTAGGASTFETDCLLQQPNDVAGLISPDQMRPAVITSPTWQINPNQLLGCSVVSAESFDLEFSPISGEGVFAQRDGLGATASVIVGDNHF